jgi:hypothetical protein
LLFVADDYMLLRWGAWRDVSIHACMSAGPLHILCYVYVIVLLGALNHESVVP